VAPLNAGASSNAPVARPGTVGIQLIGVHGAPSSDPLSHSYIVSRLAPGAVLVRTVQVDNNSKVSIDVSVYAAGASVAGGIFKFANGNDTNDLASWTSLGQSTLHLAPSTKVFDTVTTKVPLDAVSGEHYAVVWAAVSSVPLGKGGLTLVSRVGVRMYIAVGPGGATPPNFGLGILQATRDLHGDSILVTHVHNSGTRTLNLSGVVKLSKGPNGLHAGPFRATLGVLLSPGATESVAVDLAPNFPRGPWTADLQVSSGTTSHSTSRTITFPALHRVGNVDLARELSLILFALVIGAIFSFVFVRRRRRQP